MDKSIYYFPFTSHPIHVSDSSLSLILTCGVWAVSCLVADLCNFSTVNNEIHMNKGHLKYGVKGNCLYLRFLFSYINTKYRCNGDTVVWFQTTAVKLLSQ